MKTLLLLAAALAFPVVAGGADKDDLNDAKIAHIVVTANQVDIDAGKVAASKSKPAISRKRRHQARTCKGMGTGWSASIRMSIRKRRILSASLV